MSTSDQFIDPDTGILTNLVGARTAAELEVRETDLVEVRTIELAARPISGRFDLAHLQAIHRHLFQDVYPWAGRLRTVDMVKVDDPGNAFLPHQDIPRAAAHVFERVADQHYLRGLTRPKFLSRLADLLADANYIHAFREGNGRTQRQFLGQLADRAGYRIDWAAIPPGLNDQASAAARRSVTSEPLRQMLDPIIRSAAPPPLTARRTRPGRPEHRPHPRPMTGGADEFGRGEPSAREPYRPPPTDTGWER